MVYEPMLQLLGLLRQHELSCWVFSGGGADFMRPGPAVYGIPIYRVIGSLGSTEFRIGADDRSWSRAPTSNSSTTARRSR